MRRMWWLAPLVLAAGCYKAELERTRADAQALAAEKDSLITEVLETSKFVNSVNEELARARTAIVTSSAAEGGTPAERDRVARAAALDRVQALVNRLNETEQRLEQSTQRARSLAGRNSTLVRQIEEYKASIDSLQASAARTEAELRGIIDSQSVRIAGLEAERGALLDTVSNLTQYKNTVFYTAGTEADLLARGVVEKEGKRFLFFGSKHLVPARHLDPAQFTALDKSAAAVIPLPAGDRRYRLVSRQDLSYADTSTVRDGKLSGELRIASPEEFWAASRFLIMVEN